MNPRMINNKNVADGIIKNLKTRNMEGYYFETAEEAVKAITEELIPEGSSIGWGGSMSNVESGLLDRIKEGNFTVFNRDTTKTPEERKKVMSQIFGCDYFLMSTNAITRNGELVNIDGTSNRVSFLCFGPSHVIILCGMNKVADNVEDALARARNVAAPINAVRLSRKTPCSITGKCESCQSPDCICCQTVITRRSSVAGRITVVLVGEELGY